jgi:hypothetical protein
MRRFAPTGGSLPFPFQQIVKPFLAVIRILLLTASPFVLYAIWQDDPWLLIRDSYALLAISIAIFTFSAWIEIRRDRKGLKSKHGN